MKKGFWKYFWKQNKELLITVVVVISAMLYLMLNPNIEMIPGIREMMLWPMGLIFITMCILFVVFSFISSKDKFLKEENDREISMRIAGKSKEMKPIVFDKSKKIHLTPEEIKDIHARGKLTPTEKVKDWEDWDSCPLGDAIGSATSRCMQFQENCHVCLTDLANTKREWDPIVVHPFVASGIFNDTNE